VLGAKRLGRRAASACGTADSRASTTIAAAMRLGSRGGYQTAANRQLELKFAKRKKR
jgi:hypothetical protein